MVPGPVPWTPGPVPGPRGRSRETRGRAGGPGTEPGVPGTSGLHPILNNPTVLLPLLLLPLLLVLAVGIKDPFPRWVYRFEVVARLWPVRSESVRASPSWEKSEKPSPDWFEPARTEPARKTLTVAAE
jgi:hypothetical protein